MATKLSARQKDAAPSLSSERRALAERIRVQTTHQARRNAAAAAYEAAARRVYELDEQLADAERTIDEAKRAQAHRLIAAQLDEPEAPGLSVRDARRQHTDLLDERDIAVETRDTLARQLTELEREGQWLPSNTEAAALAVLKAEATDYTRQLARDVVEAQMRLLRLGSELMWLTKTAHVLPTVQEHGARYGRPTDDDIAFTVVLMSNLGQLWPPELVNALEAKGEMPWIATLAALMADAGAQLPLKD